MAMGAQPRDILRLVLGETARLTISGLAVGVTPPFKSIRWPESLSVVTAWSSLFLEDPLGNPFLNGPRVL